MDAIDKIKKLLALSKSSNPHEAANAAARAAELMFQHKIEAADLEIAGEAKRPIEAVGESTLNGGKWREPWKGVLGEALARSMSCRVYWFGPRLQIIGRKSDIETVHYLFGFFVLEIERMGAEAWKTRRELVFEHGTKWKNSFRWGATHAISRRLQEQTEAKAAAGVDSNALVLLRRDEAEVEQVLERKKLRKGPSGRSSSADGYALGRRAGRDMQMSGARGAIDASKQRIQPQGA